MKNPPTDPSDLELEDVIKRDDGPEFKAPHNPEYSSDFDEDAGREDVPRDELNDEAK